MKNRTLVIYHYFEKDQSYIDNFLNFIVFGYFEDIDYIIAIAGESTIDFPKLENIEYIRTENINNDYGGYSQVISKTPRVLDYDHVIFVNSSVRGPFVQVNCGKRWTDFFLDKIQGEVGLVGSTINILPADSFHGQRYYQKHAGTGPLPHVQTMVYAMPQAVLQYLVEGGFYAEREQLDKYDVIEEYEIKLTQLVLAKGWNIASILPEYCIADYRGDYRDINPAAMEGDPSYPFAYFGRSAHPFEVIFVKTNRGIFNLKYLERLSHSALYNRPLPKQLISSKSVSRYVSRIITVKALKDQIPLEEQRLTPEQVIHFAGLLLKQYPEARVQIEDLLKSAVA